jgi:biopolymer transport protein ExbB
MTQSMTQITAFLDRGGPALWAIAALSVLGLALILWKLWRLWRAGLWRRDRAESALSLWTETRVGDALAMARAGRSPRARVLARAMAARLHLPEPAAREETARAARAVLAETRAGLRTLDLIVTIAPLIGLLGTVLGMIDAFQALQETGNRADPAALAGGIWEALLTTAAGMGVAIPASIALSGFDSAADGLAHDLEDMAVRLFALPLPDKGQPQAQDHAPATPHPAATTTHAATAASAAPTDVSPASPGSPAAAAYAISPTSPAAASYATSPASPAAATYATSPAAASYATSPASPATPTVSAASSPVSHQTRPAPSDTTAAQGPAPDDTAPKTRGLDDTPPAPARGATPDHA